MLQPPGWLRCGRAVARLETGRCGAARVSGTSRLWVSTLAWRLALNQRRGSARPGPPEIGVLAVEGHQVVVRAQLGDPTVDDDRDPVGVVRGVQPVRDGDDCAP